MGWAPLITECRGSCGRKDVEAYHESWLSSLVPLSIAFEFQQRPLLPVPDLNIFGHGRDLRCLLIVYLLFGRRDSYSRFLHSKVRSVINFNSCSLSVCATVMELI